MINTGLAAKEGKPFRYKHRRLKASRGNISFTQETASHQDEVMARLARR